MTYVLIFLMIAVAFVWAIMLGLGAAALAGALGASTPASLVVGYLTSILLLSCAVIGVACCRAGANP